jgi:hypothetical protein
MLSSCVVTKYVYVDPKDSTKIIEIQRPRVIVTPPVSQFNYDPFYFDFRYQNYYNRYRYYPRPIYRVPFPRKPINQRPIPQRPKN